jgi:hypothetical protein
MLFRMRTANSSARAGSVGVVPRCILPVGPGCTERSPYVRTYGILYGRTERETEGNKMDNQEIAREAIIEIAKSDEYWREGDERLITVDETDEPDQFAFAVAGTFGTDYGCVIVRDGKADVHYHDENSGERCQVCGWSYVS